MLSIPHISPQRRRAISLVTGIVCVAFAIAATRGADDSPTKVHYEGPIKELLRQRCSACHNPNKKSGDLDITNFTSLMQGGGSGAVIEPGDASGSYLVKLVAHEEEPHMPPDADRLPDGELQLLRDWIEGGALENANSKAPQKRKKVAVSLTDASSERPSVVAMPGRLSLQSMEVGARATGITAIATSPWAPLVAVASNHQVALYHAASLELLGVLPFPEGHAHVLKFSRNGSLLLVGGGRGGASGRAVLFDVATGQRVGEFGDELDVVLAADMNATQTLVALGGPQKMLRAYSVETGALIYEVKKHTDWITALEFSPDGVLLATGDRNGGVYVWEGATGREYLTLKNHTAQIEAISWRIDSNVVATGSLDTTIRLWELENGSEIKGWGAHGGGVTDIEFLRDGRLASCGRDRVAKVWDQNGAQQLVTAELSDIATAATVCDESARLFIGDWSGAITAFQISDGVKVGELVANVPTIESRIGTLHTALAEIEARHAAATAAQTTAREQLAQWQSLLDKTRHAREVLETEWQSLQAVADPRTTATLARALNPLRQTLDQFGSIIAEGESTLAGATQQLQAVDAAWQTVEQERATKTSELTKWQQALAFHQASQRLQAQLAAAMQQRADSQAQEEAAAAAHTQATAARTTAETTVRELEDQLRVLQQQ